VGVGYPLEAVAKLAGPIRAGRWQLVGDGLVIEAADITYEVIWRGAGGDQPIVSFQHHFDPPPAGPGRYQAVPFEGAAEAAAVMAKSGEELVLKFSAMSASTAPSPFIPNGDGANAKGRIPSLRLP
jgi:hypothetical protein